MSLYNNCSETTASVPTQASTLRIGGYVLVGLNPCKVVEYSSSGTGKHGKCKIHFICQDLFSTKKRHEFAVSSTKNIEVPVVEVVDYQLINIDEEGYLSLLDKKGVLYTSLALPGNKDLSQTITNYFNLDKTLQLSVLKSMGMEEVIQFKVLDG
ncbi:hypothetical protein DFA_07140 [Cavenderia fasciculata]|uniref:Eukaryotic translation initiation factor 5A n=1 Tax=Cavenderia fasciculata TaxID=261658 RepID=F4PVL0_CACFS|nr:uncharacterized protein DFA_07140 [Cavenderia fasciculata]EGG20024.1 hypothetical protein DFA_07140 [Cavenderia fasciculata]|eukprot:XP_004367007.1 hypothetical protein DFA_07140 [Cavenderia fasciculata]